MKYYEIYVSGKNGFSCYVKTEKNIPNSELDEFILNAAVANKLIDGDDAKDIFRGDGYIESIDESELNDRLGEYDGASKVVLI